MAVHTQAEFDAAVAAPDNETIFINGSEEICVRKFYLRTIIAMGIVSLGVMVRLSLQR